MATATYAKINDWLDNKADAADVNADTFMIALSNTAPASETSDPTADTNGILGNVTQIAYTNYSDDLTVDRTMEGITSSQASGTYTLDSTVNIVITAINGALPDFRYIYMYDDTVASPVKPLVCVWDYGSTISLALTATATLTFNASGIYTET